MNKKLIAVLAGVCAVAASAMFYFFFVKWTPVLYTAAVVLFALAAGLLTVRFAKAKPVLRGVIAGAVFAAAFFGVTFLINNVIFHGQKAKIAGAIVSGLTLLFFILYYCLLSRKQNKTGCSPPRPSCWRSRQAFAPCCPRRGTT